MTQEQSEERRQREDAEKEHEKDIQHLRKAYGWFISEATAEHYQSRQRAEAQRDALQAQVTALRSALEYYADDKHWRWDAAEGCQIFVPPVRPRGLGPNAVAQAALTTSPERAAFVPAPDAAAGECDTCEGTGSDGYDNYETGTVSTCPTCTGTGKADAAAGEGADHV